MEPRPPDPQTVAAAKSRLRNKIVVDIANPAEACRLLWLDPHAQLVELLDTIGHQPLTAGLVDRGMTSVEHLSFKPDLAQSNRSGKARRPSPYDENPILSSPTHSGLDRFK
jgi:predicted dinucleotide-binding enzyme